MFNSIGSSGGTRQDWDDLIDASLKSPPIDPVVFEGFFLPHTLTGSPSLRGASSSHDLPGRVSPLDPGLAHDLGVLFADTCGLRVRTFGDDDDVSQRLLLPLVESGLLPFVNGAAAASAAAEPFPPKDSGLALESTDQALQLDKRKHQDDMPLELPRKKQKRDKVSEHSVAAEWHPRNSKAPDDYTQGSSQLVWWQCKRGHEWIASISDRCRLTRPTGCSTCTNHSVAGSRELLSAHPAAAEWHPSRNEKSPDDYTQGSGQLVWWQCSAGHEWKGSINDRCRLTRPTGCSTCTNHSPAGSRGLVSEHSVAAEWHPRNLKGPDQYTQGSRHIMWWKCKSGHEWEASIFNRCRLKAPRGCPTCRSKNV